jgi:hypothetical protein
MKPTIKQVCAALGLVLAGLGTAQAAPTVSISTSLGTQYTTTQVSDSTNGAGMAGMTVTVCDSAGCEARIWAATGIEGGGASGNGWSLTLNGDSFSAAFVLETTRAITSFSMDGRIGETTFDITTSPEATPGSELGFPFAFVSSSDPEPREIRVAYSDALRVDEVFYDDLYLVMQVDFSSASFLGRLLFQTDTDNTAVISPFSPNPVPEPATLALALAALLSLAAVRRASLLRG